jgi:hypothetical protein
MDGTARNARLARDVRDLIAVLDVRLTALRASGADGAELALTIEAIKADMLAVLHDAQWDRSHRARTRTH